MKLFRNISLALFAVLSLASCNGDKKEAKQEDERPIVDVKNVFAEDVPQIIDYTATVEGYKVNSISTSTPNRIRQILVDVGDNVHAGQTLVTLDDVNIAQMKLNLENYKRDLDRAEELVKIGGGTQQTVDQLRTTYEAYKRQLQNANENTRLVSPVSGVVSAKNYNPGDMTGQQAILVIQQIQPVKVIINVGELEFSKVSVGMTAKMTFDAYGDEEFIGKVARIHPTIDAATRTFKVELNIANNDRRVRPGMFGRVVMDFGSAHHVVVPDLAVVKQTGSGNKYVYVYKDGKVNFVQVQLGQRLESRYELISGVENGAQVVISGQSRLADGAEVRLVSEIKKQNANAKATTDSAKTENKK